MRKPSRTLRLRQVSSTLAVFNKARGMARPQHGWLRAVREALGMSLEAVGSKLQLAKQTAQHFELAEAKGTITLQSLQRAAAALGCELLYAIVPKSGSLSDLAERYNQGKRMAREQKIREQVKRNVLRVERNMALENQAPGDVDQLIEDETKRRLERK